MKNKMNFLGNLFLILLCDLTLVLNAYIFSKSGFAKFPVENMVSTVVVLLAGLVFVRDARNNFRQFLRERDQRIINNVINEHRKGMDF